MLLLVSLWFAKTVLEKDFIVKLFARKISVYSTKIIQPFIAVCLPRDQESCLHRASIDKFPKEGKTFQELIKSEMEGDAEARAVLEIIRRNAGPGNFKGKIILKTWDWRFRDLS